MKGKLVLVIFCMLVFFVSVFSLNNQENLKADPPAYITITGQWQYLNETLVVKNVRHAIVELYDIVEFPVVRKLADAVTDNNGYYSFTIPMDESDGLDIYINVLSESSSEGKSRVYVYPGNSGLRYTESTLLYSPVFSDLNIPSIPISSDNRIAFFILDQAFSAYEELLNLNVKDKNDNIWDLDQDGVYVNDLWHQPTIGFKWPVDQSGSDFQRNFYTINIAPSSQWEKDTIQHEYSHAVMWKLYYNAYPKGNYVSDHFLFRITNEHTALVEGWAEFLPNVLQRDDYYDGIHVETENQYRKNRNIFPNEDPWQGNRIEGAVLNILYDISDDFSFNDLNPGKDDDGIPGAFVKVWNIMRDYKPDAMAAYSGSDRDFWSAWFDAGYGYLKEMNAIYWEHGIQKNTNPQFQFTSPNGGWYSDSVPIIASGYDSDGKITKIRFQYSTDNIHFYDIGTVTNPVGNATTTWQTDWGIDSLTDSTVWVRAYVTDSYKWNGEYKEMNTTLFTNAVSFGVDNTNPKKPNIKSSHKEDKWSSDSNVYFNWKAVTDVGSGLGGYAFVLDNSPDTIPFFQNLGADSTSMAYYDLPDGDNWYFHLRAVDIVGNMGETDHYGPIKIKTYHYITPYIFNEGTAQKIRLKIDGSHVGPYQSSGSNAYAYFPPVYLEEGYHNFEVNGKDFGTCTLNDVYCDQDGQLIYVGKLFIPKYFVYPYIYNNGAAQNVYLIVNGVQYGPENAPAYSNFYFPSLYLEEGSYDFEVYGAEYGSCSIDNAYIDNSIDIYVGELQEPPKFFVYTSIYNDGPAQQIYLTVNDVQYGPENAPANDYFYFPSLHLEEGTYNFQVQGADYGFCYLNSEYIDTSTDLYIGELVEPPSYFIYPYVYNKGPAQQVFLKVDDDTYGPENANAKSNFYFPSVYLVEGYHTFTVWGSSFGYCSTTKYIDEGGVNVYVGKLKQ